MTSHDDPTDTHTATHVWPTFVYNDALAAIAFLEDAFGFSRTIVVANERDDTIVEHAQLRWPEGGGVMLGSSGRPGNPFAARPTGVGSAYVVTAEPDAVHERAIAAGAEIFQPLTDESYGNRSFSVKDPEGNVWSFGSYGGER